MKAAEALLRQLQADGIGVIFGNPGSTEENFLQAVGQARDLTYVLGLQEASVAAMADGWARMRRRAAVCQVHSAVGLGNAMGVMYEAYRSHTPIVFLAGEPPLDLQAYDGFLAGDLVRLAEPITKWAARLSDARQLTRLVRRAVKVAQTPPCGPVFLALPMDTLEGNVEEGEIFPGTSVTSVSACSMEAAETIAHALRQARHPLLLVGDGIAEAEAQEALQHLAESLAAPVWGVECNEPLMPFGHPLFMGLIGHSFGEHTRSITQKADVILSLGTPLFPELFPSRDPYFAKDAKLFQIDRDPWEIGKNFAPTLGVQADPRSSLVAISEALQRLGKPTAEELSWRRSEVATIKEACRSAIAKEIEAIPDECDQMSPATMMRTLADDIPADALIYDESLTSTAALLHYRNPECGTYMLARGGCIGVGWPGAIGAAIACPQKTIYAPSGDGSALFAIQSLWTAVRYKVKVIFLVCNNGAYRILKINLLHYLNDIGEITENFPYMDINAPRIDFTKLANGFGMPAVRAQTAIELKAALAQALQTVGPFLIDVQVNGALEPSVKFISGAQL